MLTFKHKVNSVLVFQLLECGGNLFDVASIAVKAALYNTKYFYLFNIFFIVWNEVWLIALCIIHDVHEIMLPVYTSDNVKNANFFLKEFQRWPSAGTRVLWNWRFLTILMMYRELRSSQHLVLSQCARYW